ncbi:hypothetical protein [Streptomyces sp. NPDC047990]|uniref:hypothetical protein n=1 Tax=Streptomyces sp. NPDC047990 TaxID=3365496 RepID=UPI003721BA05
MRALVAGVGNFPEPYTTEDEQADGVTEFTPLPAVAEAVRELASALERAGAAPGGDLLLECNEREFLQKWRDLRRQAGPAEPLVVHFAGHGVQAASGGLYLAASGGLAPADLLSDTCISFGQLLETAENSGRPVLFLLDVCEAGQALVQQQLADLAARRRQDALRNVWIIGACTSDTITYGARFTTAATAVLHQLADGDFDINPALEHVPVETLATAVDRHLARTDRAAGRARQHLVRTTHVQADADPHPFFLNPSYTPNPHLSLLAGTDPRLREFALGCSPDLDPLHFATRAAGTPTANDILFSGRRSQLDRIHKWASNANEGRMLVVTGGPGSGKSALLGVTACLLHPELEPLGDRIARAVEHFDPRQPDVVLAVHARQLTLQQITNSLHHQLRQQHHQGQAVDRRATLHTDTEALLQVLHAAGDVLVLLDALDEAADPTAVLNELLLPLVSAEADTASAGSRVLLGTRKWWDTLPALHQYLADHPNAELDLDPTTETDRSLLVDDLNTYLRRLLPRRRYSRDDVRLIADGLAQYSDHGAFLVASLYANHLRTTTHHESHTGAPPRSITEVFELHMGTLTANDPWIQTVLNVIGQARGQGMPLDLIHAAALAQRHPDSQRTAPTLADTRRTLVKAAFYLRTTPDTDHRLLYRYFHQALTDHTKPRTDPATLHRALIDTIPTTDDNTPDWAHAHHYLLRYAADHATAAHGSALDELLTDLSYLLHATPAPLTSHLHRAQTEEALLHADIYRTTVTHHAYRHKIDVRRDLLALDAAVWQEPQLAQQLSRIPIPGQPISPTPVWATRRTHTARRHTLTDHGGMSAVAVAQGPDGPLVITASIYGSAVVWDLTTGVRLHTLTGHGGVSAVLVAYGPDGPLVITANGDGSAIVWDLATGVRRRTLNGHGSLVSAVAVWPGPDGPLVITASVDGSIVVWDLDTGVRLHTLSAGGSAVSGVVVARGHDGPLAITSSYNGNAVVWDLATGVRVHTLAGHTHGLHGVNGVAVTQGPDGLLAVTANLDGSAVVWDLATGARRHTLAGHASAVSAVAVAQGPDGPLAITTSLDGSAVVWDLTTGIRRHTLAGHASAVSAVAVWPGPDGPLAITAGHDGSAIVWDLATGDRQQTLTGHVGSVPAVAVAEGPDGQLAITAGDDGSAVVWDLATAVRRRALAGHFGIVSAVAVAQGPDGQLAITASHDGSAIVWDLATGVRQHALADHVGSVNSVAVAQSPHGPLAITASHDGSAIVWDLATGVREHALTGHTGSVSAVAVAQGPDGQLAITTGDDGRGIVWDLDTGACRHTLTGHFGIVSAVAVAQGPDGPLAITTSHDGSAIVWDLATGTRRHTLTGHTDNVNSVAVAQSPHGPLAITTSHDGSIIIWDLHNFRSLYRYQLPHFSWRVAAIATGFVVTYDAEVAYFEWPANLFPA